MHGTPAPEPDQEHDQNSPPRDDFVAWLEFGYFLAHETRIRDGRSAWKDGNSKVMPRELATSLLFPALTSHP